MNFYFPKSSYILLCARKNSPESYLHESNLPLDLFKEIFKISHHCCKKIKLEEFFWFATDEK